MLVLIVYDIQASAPAGRARLHRVAKKCESIGKRVQNSVFECLLDAAQFRRIEESLLGMIDPEQDHLRFYNLGNHYQSRIIDHGKDDPCPYEAPLIL